MSRKIFERYWNNRYADAPDGQPHNDPNVPYEHLQKYANKQVQIVVTGPFLLSTHGSFRVDVNAVGVVWDGGDIFIAKETLGTISWNESEKAYQCKGPSSFISIKPLS